MHDNYNPQAEAHLKAIKNGWICTFTGKRFYPAAPCVADFDARDIAHSLSMQCRYNGHVGRFYSVAEHCLIMCEEIAYRFDFNLPWAKCLNLQKWALVHDAPEAYLGDLPYPLKQLPEFAFFRELEAKYPPLLASWLGLEGSTEPQEVKALDLEIVASEATKLYHERHPDWILPATPTERLLSRIQGLSPAEAERAYLARFRSFWPRLVKGD
jgi:hypothetical protein